MLTGLKEVFRKIKIVPLSSILLHEGVVSEWTEHLSTNIDHDGMVKNPIIVTPHESRYIALDGMHRITALKALGCRDVVVYEVDYFDPAISLHGWDALILDSFPVQELLQEFVRRENQRLVAHDNLGATVENVRAHRSCFGLLTRGGEVFEVMQEANPVGLDTLIRLLKDFEQELDRKHLRVIYVADEQSRDVFEAHRSASCLLKRPFFTKEEVIRRTLEGKVLPRKSTRHLFPMRPLRIDIDFILLKEDIDLETKNHLLQARLNWCLEHSMVRYYPESVLILSD